MSRHEESLIDIVDAPTQASTEYTKGGLWADDSGDVGFVGEVSSSTPPRGLPMIGGIQIDKNDMRAITQIIPRELIAPLSQLLFRELLAKDGISATGLSSAIENVARTTVSAGVKDADDRAKASVASGLSDIRLLSHRIDTLEAEFKSLSALLTERTEEEMALYAAAKDVVSDHAELMRTQGGDPTAFDKLQERAQKYSEEITRLQQQLSAVKVTPTLSSPVLSRKKKGVKPAWVKE